MEGLPVLHDILPCYQPRHPDTGKPIEPRPVPAHKTWDKWDSNMSLIGTLVAGFFMVQAFRELIQNWLDAICKANGNTFAGLRLSRDADNTKVFLHSDQLIYGTVRMEGSVFRLTNYGPIIDSWESLLVLGASEKRLENNQAGRYGEGLKRAALRCVISGYTIHIVFPLNGPEVELRRIEFGRGAKNCMDASIKPIGITEQRKKTPYPHRFEVIINMGQDAHAFDIRDHLVSKPELLRSMRDANDGGSLIVDPAFRSRIYICHLHITTMVQQWLRWGYDFFATIGRDRSGVNSDDLNNAVAKVWNYEIVEHPDMARLFYDEIFTNDAELRYFEASCISALNRDALATLRTMAGCDGPDMRAVTRAEYAQIEDMVCADFVKVLPARAVQALNTGRGTLNDYIQHETRILATPATVATRCVLLGTSVYAPTKLVWVVQPRARHPLRHATHGNEVFLSLDHWGHCVNAMGVITDEAAFWTDFTLKVIEDKTEKRNMLRARMTAPPPAANGMPPPPAANDDDDDDDEVVPPNKRARPDSPPPPPPPPAPQVLVVPVDHLVGDQYIDVRFVAKQ